MACPSPFCAFEMLLTISITLVPALILSFIHLSVTSIFNIILSIALWLFIVQLSFFIKTMIITVILLLDISAGGFDQYMKNTAAHQGPVYDRLKTVLQSARNMDIS